MRTASAAAVGRARRPRVRRRQQAGRPAGHYNDVTNSCRLLDNLRSPVLFSSTASCAAVLLQTASHTTSALFELSLCTLNSAHITHAHAHTHTFHVNVSKYYNSLVEAIDTMFDLS